MDMDENDKKGSEEGSRARNRTVMLTPDVTSQVRNRLAQELGADANQAQPSRGGFETPVRGQFGGGSGVPRLGNEPAVRPSPAVGGRAPVVEQPVEENVEGVYWIKESPIIGFLVSYDRNENGEFFELRGGRIMVTTSARPGENSLVLIDESVSPMHAILRIGAEGDIQVLDQLSEQGTAIARADGSALTLSGDKGELYHGDIVTFGSRAFHVCVVPRRKPE